MRFSELARYLEKLEQTSSRNEITRILGDVFSRARAQEIDKICYLLLGELVPAYQGVEFQIAEKIMIQILASAYDRPAEDVARAFGQKGDLGDLAYNFSSESRGKNTPSVEEVYRRLMGVAQEGGEGSQERKVRLMVGILADLDRVSAKYVARIPVGKLRLGFSDATILDALSLLIAGDKSARKEIERVYNITADIGAIAALVKKGGARALLRVRARPGTPIRASLAERVAGIEETMSKAGPEVAVEQKLDGLRMQIHVWGEGRNRRVELFSRNLERTTPMFPEIVQAAQILGASSVILDGEAIGYNPKTGKFAPFQETIQRKRKHDISEFALKIPLSVFIFDVVYWNGKSLLDASFRKRRAALEQILSPGRASQVLRLVKSTLTRDAGEVARALEQSVRAGLEGLVVKNPEAPYEPGSRGFHWIKLKATTSALEKLREGTASGLPDTIDCLVMGGYRGRGKRTKFGIGGLLLGVRGTGDQFYSLSRLGTGLSDEQFREASCRIRAIRTPDRPKEYVVDEDTTPDIWIKPGLVVEILADEITLSSRHTAGRNKDGRGYSLRFPRLVRFRDDKNPEDTTSVAEVKKMHQGQKGAVGSARKNS